MSTHFGPGQVRACLHLPRLTVDSLAAMQTSEAKKGVTKEGVQYFPRILPIHEALQNGQDALDGSRRRHDDRLGGENDLGLRLIHGDDSESSVFG